MVESRVFEHILDFYFSREKEVKKLEKIVKNNGVGIVDDIEFLKRNWRYKLSVWFHAFRSTWLKQ